MFFCHTGDSFLGGLEMTCLSQEDSVMGAAIIPSFLEGGGGEGASVVFERGYLVRIWVRHIFFGLFGRGV